MPKNDLKRSTSIVKRLIIAIVAAAILSACLAAGIVGLDGFLQQKTQIFDNQFFAQWTNYFIICFLLNLLIVFLLIAKIISKSK
jgi:hypothetical protein